jgi:hypothetical protein
MSRRSDFLGHAFYALFGIVFLIPGISNLLLWPSLTNIIGGMACILVSIYCFLYIYFTIKDEVRLTDGSLINGKFKISERFFFIFFAICAILFLLIMLGAMLSSLSGQGEWGLEGVALDAEFNSPSGPDDWKIWATLFPLTILAFVVMLMIFSETAEHKVSRCASTIYRWFSGKEYRKKYPYPSGFVALIVFFGIVFLAIGMGFPHLQWLHKTLFIIGSMCFFIFAYLIIIGKIRFAETIYVSPFLDDQKEVSNDHLVLNVKEVNDRTFGDKKSVRPPLDFENDQQKALELYKEGNFTECIDVCDAILRKGANDASIYNTKATALAQLEQYDESMEAITIAVDLEPNNGKYAKNKRIIQAKINGLTYPSE